MRKALSVPLLVSDPASWLWAVLFGELAVSALLLLEGAVAPIAARALQLFRRF